MRIQLLFLFAFACHNHGFKAPFPEYPGSATPGNLCGQFTGRVLDAETGNPIAGAFVQATWTHLNTAGVSPHQDGFTEQTVATEVNGSYSIPSRRCSGNIADFKVLVYKKGFIAFRSDRRYSDFGPNREFSQRNQTVLLKRWSANDSHVKHLRYVGNSPAVAALTRWEVPLAVSERSGSPLDIVSPFSTRTHLPATSLLTEELIRTVTLYKGPFETGPMGDEPDTENYSSQRFRATGKPPTYDIGLRIWKLDSSATTEERYDELLTLSSTSSDFPGLVKSEGDKAFSAKESNISALGVLLSDKQTVFFLTCGQELCRSETDLATIARSIIQRIERSGESK